MKHDYYTSCGRDECDGSCNLCTLAVCKLCGGGEGSLTTECPGEKYDYDAVYAGVKDYRNGEWVNGCTVHLVNKIVQQNYGVLRDRFGWEIEILDIVDKNFNIFLNRLFVNPDEEFGKWCRPAENERCRFATFGTREYCETRRLCYNRNSGQVKYSHVLYVVTGVMKPATVEGKRIYLP